MDHWDLRTIDVPPRQPQILQSERGEGRAIAINLPAGEEMQEHENHERAYVVVVDGEVEISGEQAVTAGTGTLAVFDPHERRAIRAVSDARLLLVLAPWPGPGHPGARDD